MAQDLGQWPRTRCNGPAPGAIAWRLEGTLQESLLEEGLLEEGILEESLLEEALLEEDLLEEGLLEEGLLEEGILEDGSYFRQEMCIFTQKNGGSRCRARNNGAKRGNPPREYPPGVSLHDGTCPPGGRPPGG